mmetsp:Transcript_15698/g.16287  ORF Transcript_15698/g.16287 Transcript_15698/m.16287 type:complete len:231 (-) Transcript_15698:41-733(-)
MMIDFTSLLSSGSQNTSPIWTEPYLEISGIGNIITAAISIYDSSTVPPFLVGVVGIDITINDLLEFGTIEQLGQTFKTRTQSGSSTMNLSNCQIEQLRTRKCGLSGNCSNTIKTEYQQCSSPLTKVFCEDEATMEVQTRLPDDYSCCRCMKDSTKAQILAIWILFGVFFILFIIFLVLYFTIKEIKRDDDYTKASNTQTDRNESFKGTKANEPDEKQNEIEGDTKEKENS